jgi:hypothetical protein
LRRAAASSRHIFQNNQLASHPGGTSAHGSPGLANGGSCDAHAVYSGSTSAAGGRDFRDHAVSGCAIGAGVIACADTATDKANPAIALNLIILHLPKPAKRSDLRKGDDPALVLMPCKLAD